MRASQPLSQFDHEKESILHDTYNSKVSTADTQLESYPDLTTDVKSKYKTEICKNYELYGCCQFGLVCNYAHGMLELRQRADLPAGYKTRLCKNFHNTGSCAYGPRCQFIHKKRKVTIADTISVSTYS